MADTVRRIERSSFRYYNSLVFVKLSRNLEFIRESSFWYCDSLPSIFIPLHRVVRLIEMNAFHGCKELIILSVPQTTKLGEKIINGTALILSFPFETYYGRYQNNDDINAWIKNVNGDDEQYALHRACLSYNPITGMQSSY